MKFELPLELLKIELITKYSGIDIVLHRYASPSEIIEKIETLMYNVIKKVSSDESPELEGVNDRSLVTEDGNAKTYVIAYKRSASRLKFAGIMFLLSKIHSLLLNNQISTRRELYYENTTLFQSQNQVDKNLKDINYMLNAPSWEMGILATSKGLVAGPLSFAMADGSVISCNQDGGVSVPQNVLGIHTCTSKAKWILIIEKDAAFQKLLNNDGLSKLGPVIFITAKGYPDVNTRLLINILWKQLKIPILCLVDADPHGIEIMSVYRFGSTAMTSFSEYLACPAIRWLGVHPGDMKSLAVESKELTNRDVKKINSLLNRPYVEENPQLKSQIEILIRENKKVEIEGISQISRTYLTEVYLPNKIIAKEYY